MATVMRRNSGTHRVECNGTLVLPTAPGHAMADRSEGPHELTRMPHSALAPRSKTGPACHCWGGFLRTLLVLAHSRAVSFLSATLQWEQQCESHHIAPIAHHARPRDYHSGREPPSPCTHLLPGRPLAFPMASRALTLRLACAQLLTLPAGELLDTMTALQLPLGVECQHTERALRTAQMVHEALARPAVHQNTIADITRLLFQAAPGHLWEAVWHESRDPHLHLHYPLMDTLQALASRTGWAPAPLPPLVAPPEHVLSQVAAANHLTEQPAAIITAACDSLEMHWGQYAYKAIRLLHVAMAFATTVAVEDDAIPAAIQLMERHATQLGSMSRQSLYAPLQYAGEVRRTSPAWQGTVTVLYAAMAYADLVEGQDVASSHTPS